MPLLYCFIGRPSIPLVEHSKPGCTGNFSAVTSVLSKRLPVNDGCVSYLYDAYTFHCLTSSSLHFVALSTQSFSRSVAFQFLADVRSRFLACYLPQLQSSIATPNNATALPPPTFPSSFSIPLSLQADFSGELARLLARYSTDDERMQRMRDELADTTDSMLHNVDALMQRGERLELLEVKTAQLEGSSLRFKANSWELQRSLFWSNARLSILSAAAACTGLYLLLSMACGGLSLSSC